jgi:hypothetical protein
MLIDARAGAEIIRSFEAHGGALVGFDVFRQQRRVLWTCDETKLRN